MKLTNNEVEQKIQEQSTWITSWEGGGNTRTKKLHLQNHGKKVHIINLNILFCQYLILITILMLEFYFPKYVNKIIIILITSCILKWQHCVSITISSREEVNKNANRNVRMANYSTLKQLNVSVAWASPLSIIIVQL